VTTPLNVPKRMLPPPEPDAEKVTIQLDTVANRVVSQVCAAAVDAKRKVCDIKQQVRPQVRSTL
jgi:hypothetical protein